MRTETDTKTIFLRAAELVEQGWTTTTMARDKGGDPVWWDDARAVRFCAMGAVWRASADAGLTLNDTRWLASLLRESVGNSASGWNDAPGRTAEEVAAKLRELWAACPERAELAELIARQERALKINE